MIDTHETLVAKASDGRQAEFEVNWSADPEVAGCKMVKVRVGAEELVVPFQELFNIVMVCGKEGDQKKMIPVKVTNVKVRERRLHFKVKCRKDYRAGEILEVVCPWIDQMPVEDEVFAGNLAQGKNKIA